MLYVPVRSIVTLVSAMHDVIVGRGRGGHAHKLNFSLRGFLGETFPRQRAFGQQSQCAPCNYLGVKDMQHPYVLSHIISLSCLSLCLDFCAAANGHSLHGLFGR